MCDIAQAAAAQLCWLGWLLGYRSARSRPAPAATVTVQPLSASWFSLSSMVVTCEAARCEPAYDCTPLGWGQKGRGSNSYDPQCVSDVGDYPQSSLQHVFLALLQLAGLKRRVGCACWDQLDVAMQRGRGSPGWQSDWSCAALMSQVYHFLVRLSLLERDLFFVRLQGCENTCVHEHVSRMRLKRDINAHVPTDVRGA